MQPAQRLGVGATDDRIAVQPFAEVFVQSGGVPRAIGNLALTAMFNSAAHNKDLVDIDDVTAASREVS